MKDIINKNKDERRSADTKRMFAEKKEIAQFEDNRLYNSRQKELKVCIDNGAKVAQRLIYIGTPLITLAHVDRVRWILRGDIPASTLFDEWRRSNTVFRRYQDIPELIAAIRYSLGRVPVTSTRRREEPLPPLAPVRETFIQEPSTPVQRPSDVTFASTVSAGETSALPRESLAAPIVTSIRPPLPPLSEPEATALSPGIHMNQESRTRVGVEIEPGNFFSFSAKHFGELEALTNQTLATYYFGGRPYFEFLLDDMSRDGNEVRAQVEYRSLPIDFEAYTTKLGALMPQIIGSFNMQTVFSRTTDFSPGFTGWVPSALMHRNSFLRCGRGEHGNTMATVQHATLSIEIEAYCQLPESQQAALFPAGRGARNKQQLLRLMAGVMHGDSGMLDASAGARTRQVATVKSPLESILAADPSLRIPEMQSLRRVRVDPGNRYVYPLRNLQDGVDEIRRTTQFPAMQGENTPVRGYHAIAEKLQPPLVDSTSGELRLLVEHRVDSPGSLVRAVREILNPSFYPRGSTAPRMDDVSLRRITPSLRPMAAAARAMDDARLGEGAHNSSIEAYVARLQASRLRAMGLATSVAESPFAGSSTIGYSSLTRTEVEGSSLIHAPGWVLTTAPLLVPPPMQLNLAALVAYYLPGITWARGRGTFSPEYALFQGGNLAATLVTLQAGGLDATGIAIIQAVLPGIIAAHPQGQNAHPSEEVQEYIFDQVDVAHGRALWALLRFFRAHGL